MSTAPPPQPPRRPPRLQRLRARHARWRAARAARRAFFARPTPISTHLKLIARLHRLVDLIYAILSLLIGLKFLWRLANWNLEGVFYTLVQLVTWPLVQPFEQLIPPIELGPRHRIESGDLVALVVCGLICRLVHWLIHRFGYMSGHLAIHLRREADG